MEKKSLLGVHKRKPIKRVKKNLLKKVADYLIPDSYLFAPLFSPQPNTFPPSRVEFGEPIKKINNKNAFKKIGEFLISDYYMYASLVAPQSIVTPTEPSWHIKRVTTAVSTRKVTMIDKEPTDRSSKKVAKDQSSKNLLHETSISEKTLGHREMVKHMVYQNCCSTSISGKEMLKFTAKEAHC
ncbi:hypothetical protein SO802_000485 [Lithocarpus litseifolius]|uniref:Uncharacterized protein n=1 Tax=Lithocarpus litseifolius TaxID=425828 RepID=A0AAW2DXG0_9ROSI